jgi:hypothetical protein
MQYNIATAKAMQYNITTAKAMQYNITTAKAMQYNITTAKADTSPSAVSTVSFKLHYVREKHVMSLKGRTTVNPKRGKKPFQETKAKTCTVQDRCKNFPEL